MKKTAVFLVLGIVALVIGATYLGQQDSSQTVSQRSRNAIFTPQLAPPYTWMDTVNLVTDTLWTCPDTVRVCEIRMLKPGTYQMQLWRSAARPYIADTCDILRVDLRRLYGTGTSTACKTGSIKVFGFIK